MGSRNVAGKGVYVTPSIGPGRFPYVGPVGPASGNGDVTGDAVVTVGTSGTLSERYGVQLINGNTYGSISPNPYLVGPDDVEADYIYYLVSTTSWNVFLAGNDRPQDYFTSITIQLAAGDSEIELLTADADTHGNSGSRTAWTWVRPNVAGSAWNSGDVGNNRGVTIAWPA